MHRYMMKKIIHTPNAPLPIGSYNQANAFNGLQFGRRQTAGH
jgi:enamine deaminase RidA (YjgF/YER057c/UK114 family)